MLFAIRGGSRDIMQRLDLPLIVFHRRLLEWSVASWTALGGAILIAPGPSLLSPAYRQMHVIPEWAWGHVFLTLGCAHFGLLTMSYMWAMRARVAVLSLTLTTYVAMASLIAAVNPGAWAFYTTLFFAFLTSVCLARVRYDWQQCRSATDAGLV